MLKLISQHTLFGISVPALLLLFIFLTPEPYSHPFIKLGAAPTEIMPFLENKQFLRELTISLFGRMTPNYAPITIVFLITFWFVLGIFVSLLARWVIKLKNV